MTALLAAILACSSQDGEPWDPLDWARALGEVEKRWIWGEFEIEPGGAVVLDFFAVGKEAPGVTVEDPALRSDRYRRNHPAEHPGINGRLDLWLDAFYGKWLEAFVDGRLDGTTAGQGVVGERFEQYWLRVMIPDEPAAAVELGRFSAPLGNFIPRSDPWKNPLTTWPLAYDDPTAFVGLKERPAALTLNRDQPDFKDWVVPIWQAVYGTGAMALGSVQTLSYAVAITNAAPATQPYDWVFRAGDYRYPDVYLHASWAAAPSTTVGLSGARGPIDHDNAPGVPPGRHAGDFPQSLAGVDLSYAVGALEVWAEAYWTRFESPLVPTLGLWTWYVEAKYTVAPGLFGAVRFAEMLFGDAKDPSGALHQWDRDLLRIEVGGGYFLTRNLFVKATVQVNLTMGGQDPMGNMLMVQAGLTF
jgi:hypothetical protein